jgi:hypothetical protein
VLADVQSWQFAMSLALAAQDLATNTARLLLTFNKIYILKCTNCTYYTTKRT